MALGPPARAISDEEFSSSESQSSRSAQQQVVRIAELRRVHEAFAWFRSHARQLEDLQLQVTSIAAPPWGEAARSEWLKNSSPTWGLRMYTMTRLATSSASARAAIQTHLTS